MKKLLITLHLMILPLFVFSQTRINFQKKGQQVIVNITKSLSHNIYTYNQFINTDTSVIITTDENNFDLLLQDIRSNHNLTINIGGEKSSVIRSMNSYNVETGEPVTFIINPEDDCVLKSNLPIAFDFIATEIGTLEQTYNIPRDKNFILNKNRVYGFRYVSEHPETTTLSLTLSQGSQIIENKDIFIQSQKRNINIIAEATISASTFQYEISYEIKSSAPVLSDIELTLELKVEINGFIEYFTIDDLFLKENTTTLKDKEIKQFQGRQPRNFKILSQKLIIKKHDKNANYNTQNLKTND